MKLKSKGSIWNGYRRLYLKKYGDEPFIEFQFNRANNGLGVTWDIGESVCFFSLHIIIIELTLAVSRD